MGGCLLPPVCRRACAPAVGWVEEDDEHRQNASFTPQLAAYTPTGHTHPHHTALHRRLHHPPATANMPGPLTPWAAPPHAQNDEAEPSAPHPKPPPTSSQAALHPLLARNHRKLSVQRLGAILLQTPTAQAMDEKERFAAAIYVTSFLVHITHGQCASLSSLCNIVAGLADKEEEEEGEEEGAAEVASNAPPRFFRQMVLEMLAEETGGKENEGQQQQPAPPPQQKEQGKQAKSEAGAGDRKGGKEGVEEEEEKEKKTATPGKSPTPFHLFGQYATTHVVEVKKKTPGKEDGQEEEEEEDGGGGM